MFQELRKKIIGGNDDRKEYLDMIQTNEKGINENREKELKNMKEIKTENMFSNMWNTLFNPTPSQPKSLTPIVPVVSSTLSIQNEPIASLKQTVLTEPLVDQSRNLKNKWIT